MNEPRVSVVIEPGSMDDPERDRCFQAIQTACAGHNIGSALAAHIDSLAAVVCVAASDRANAESILASIGRDLRGATDRNWQLVKDQLATAVSEPGHG